MDEKEQLLHTIAGLEAKLAELKKRLPAHSIPPAMISELDDLDEHLEQARARLAEMINRSTE